MKTYKILTGSILCLLLVGVFLCGEGAAVDNNPPGMKVTLLLDASNSRAPDHALFVPGDTIPMILRLECTKTLATSENFSNQQFYLHLTFIGPDGKPITAEALGTAQDPPAPAVIPWDGQLLQAEPVEFWSFNSETDHYHVEFKIPDANLYFPLADAGKYSVQAIIPMRTYNAADVFQDGGTYFSLLSNVEWTGNIVSNVEFFTITRDYDLDGDYAPEALPGAPPPHNIAADCNDNDPNVHPWFTLSGDIWVRDTTHEILCNGIDDDCDLSTTDQLAGEDCYPKGRITVKAETHYVGGGSYPGSRKEPLTNAIFAAFDTSVGSCAYNYGFSWKNYESIYSKCGVSGLPVAPDSSGIATLDVLPGEYLVIGKTAEGVFIGSKVDQVIADTTETKYLQMIVKVDGKKVAAKNTIRKGSELMIIEPEYIEWTGTEELYPFIFQSIGEWGVVTSIAPPEGFVADYEELGTTVDNDLKAVQFTVTDVGSKWVSTGVNYKVKHRNRLEVIKSKIGVKNLKAEDKDTDKDTGGGKKK